MTPVPISAARKLGEQHGAERVVIIALGTENYSITSWGKTRAQCRDLATWIESEAAVDVVREIMDA